MKSVFDTLKERGLVENVTDAEAVRKMLAHPPVTFYVGFDPTADSLHVGHLLAIVVMRHLQRAGHKPIAVVGGGTGMVGDPSGKTELREMLTVERIRTNLEAQKAQLRQFLDFDSDKPNAAVMVNNFDWLGPLNYIEFLRTIGVHFTVNRMLAAECFKQRWEKGLTFIEFNYMLLQSFDFLHLYRTHGCTLQVGGSDQWGNICAGVDLIRRVEGAEAQGLIYPLLLTSTGKKMGKTEKGAVWLAADRTSPYDFYQYWRNIDDKDVEKCLRLFTSFSMDEVRQLTTVEAGPALNESKKRLAYEVTALVHGETAAQKAQADASALFRPGGKSTLGGSSDDSHMGIPTCDVTAEQLTAGLPLIDALVGLGLAETKSAARRLIQQGGVYVGGERADSIERTLKASDMQDGQILIRSGKKKHGRIVARE